MCIRYWVWPTKWQRAKGERSVFSPVHHVIKHSVCGGVLPCLFMDHIFKYTIHLKESPTKLGTTCKNENIVSVVASLIPQLSGKNMTNGSFSNDNHACIFSSGLETNKYSFSGLEMLKGGQYLILETKHFIVALGGNMLPWYLYSVPETQEIRMLRSYQDRPDTGPQNGSNQHLSSFQQCLVIVHAQKLNISSAVVTGMWLLCTATNLQTCGRLKILPNKLLLLVGFSGKFIMLC